MTLKEFKEKLNEAIAPASIDHMDIVTVPAELTESEPMDILRFKVVEGNKGFYANITNDHPIDLSDDLMSFMIKKIRDRKS